MSTDVKILMVPLVLALLLIVGGPAGAAEDLLPEDLKMAQEFKAGFGPAVGYVQLVQGEVVVMHADRSIGYRAAKDMPLFKDDTIVTLDRGRIRIQLSDGSFVTLGSETKIVINQSVYDPQKKRRTSFLSMAFGKARFLVQKLVGFRRSEFKINSPTAVLGVRGSDFALHTSRLFTRVVAFERTRLALIGRAAPHLKPTLLKDFERVEVMFGKPPSGVERLSPEQIKRIRREFTFFPGVVGPAGKVIERRRGKGVKGGAPPAGKYTGFLVPQGVLVAPRDFLGFADPADLRLSLIHI